MSTDIRTDIRIVVIRHINCFFVYMYTYEIIYKNKITKLCIHMRRLIRMCSFFVSFAYMYTFYNFVIL